MPTKSLAELRALVGTSIESIGDFTVEPGKVDEFARAIKDPAPVFTDPDAAAAAGHPAVVAPPTFTRTAYFPRYRLDGGGSDFGFDLGFERSSTVHGEQAYEYARPLYVDETLSGTTVLTDISERTGSDGATLVLATYETTYRTTDGQPIILERRTRIEINRDDAARSSATNPSPPTDPVETSERPTMTRDGNGSVLKIPPLTRLDFVRYAGASGDFNPIHVSEPAARVAGSPTVFAQGMLSAGLASRFVREQIPPDELTEFKTRFESRVWPGDRLTVTGKATDEGVQFEMRNQRDTVVLTGGATRRSMPDPAVSKDSSD